MSTETSPLVYKVAPHETDPALSSPALIFLHGRGTDENDLFGLTPYIDPRYLVVSIRAPFKFSYGGYAWFDLDEGGAIDFNQLIESREKLLFCLQEIEQKYRLRPEQTFLFGFSMGAMMSLVLGCTFPELFHGVIAHSGFLPQNDRLSAGWKKPDTVSFFIAHGSHDPIVPVELGRKTNETLAKEGADVTYREYPIEHTISNESLHDALTWMQQHL